MDIDEKNRAQLKERLDLAEAKMERLRIELAVISAAVRRDPNRELGYDKELLEKNEQLSAAIQEFLAIEREYNGEESEYHWLWK